MAKRKRKKTNSGSIWWIFVFATLLYSWKLFLLIFFFIFGIYSFKLYKKITKKKKAQKRYLLSGIDKVDTMDGETFEVRLYHHFNYKGWKMNLTKKSGDFGADLVGYDNRHRKCVIQAKRYKQTVGVSAIQEVIGAMKYYQAKRALVVTNNYFTKSAKELAEVSGVELWDRTTLINEFSKVKKSLK